MTPRRIWLILFVVACALRLPDVGNPLVDIDEQMYLLVAQRMWDGAIPYVDIWDRKPIGLFLIFAGAAGLPGDAVVAYHLLALAAATLTAGLIAAFAHRFATPVGSLAAGLVYLVWLELLGGRGGQSPVFYDLPILAAAILTFDTATGRRRAAVPAMLLAGLALQIKPTALFEGAFLGITLLVTSWRRHRSPARLIGAALLYAGVALLPTIAAGIAYAAIGHVDAWWFANVESIFLRRVTPNDPLIMRLLGVGAVLLLPAVLAIRGIASHPRGSRWFVAGWLVTATIGWLLVPPYFNHYALPLLVPLALAAATALDRRPWRIATAVVGAALLLMSGYPHWRETTDTRHRLAALATIIDRERGRGCLFVFQAPPALYSATRSCLPTRYPFPFHLTEASEAGAIGVDPVSEVARILASRPPVIARGSRPARTPAGMLVDRAIADHYRPIARDIGITLYRRRN